MSADLGVLDAFDVDEDSSFELICTDCGVFLYFGGNPTRERLTLGDVVAAAERHKCDFGEIDG